jgi:hypothetical protein
MSSERKPAKPHKTKGTAAPASAVPPDASPSAGASWEQLLEQLDPAWRLAHHQLSTGQRGMFTPEAAALGLLPSDFEPLDVSPAERIGALVAVHQELEARRRIFEKTGEGIELLLGIALCAREGLPLPAWLGKAFDERLNRFLGPGGAKSMKLDAVFDSSRFISSAARSATRAANARQALVLGRLLLHEVLTVADQHEGLDGALSTVLGAKNWGVQKTTATKLVKAEDARQQSLYPPNKYRPLSQRWSKGRKP